jgi:hypothetical protein
MPQYRTGYALRNRGLLAWGPPRCNPVDVQQIPMRLRESFPRIRRPHDSFTAHHVSGQLEAILADLPDDLLEDGVALYQHRKCSRAEHLPWRR